MRLLSRLVLLGAAFEVGSWVLATALSRGSWRYNVSALYAAGAPRPGIVMFGEAAFAVSLAALALGLRRALPRSDHRAIASWLLLIASAGAVAGALARNSCEESVPLCAGRTFATTLDWVHGVGGIAEILGISGAGLILSAVLPRPWSRIAAVAGSGVLGGMLLAGAVPYPWAGTAQRIMIVLLVAWVAAMGAKLHSFARELVA